jgi:predicted PurR-regulated permease PerM
MLDRIRRAGQVSWAVVGLAALLVLVGIVAWVVRVVWPPLILAGAIVFILNPVVTWLQHRRLPRAAGTAVAYLAVIGVLVLSGFLVAPLFSDQADQLSEDWPRLRDELYEDIDDLAERSRDRDWPVRVPTVDEIRDEFGSGPADDLGEQLDRARAIGTTVFHVLLVIVLAPIIAFYLLVDLPHLRRVAESLVPERAKPEVFVVARRLGRAIGGYFRGQIVVAFIVGTLVSIALAVLGLPFWLLIGMVAGLFNMIPLIGPWIGAIPGVIIALTTRDFGTAIWVAVIMASVQQIDNHFITPNVMQRAVKLHPAAVMLALLAGGTLGGFFGLLLAVPTAAVLKILASHLWRTYVLGEPIEELAAVWEDEDADGGVVEDVLGEDDRPPTGDEPSPEPVGTT